MRRWLLFWRRCINWAFWRGQDAQAVVMTIVSWLSTLLGIRGIAEAFGGDAAWFWWTVPFLVILLLVAPYAQYKRVNDELTVLKAERATRDAEIRIVDVAVRADIRGTVVRMWPELARAPFLVLFAQVKLTNRSDPTTFDVKGMVLGLSDGRYVHGWFLPEPIETQLTHEVMSELNLPAGRSIRQLAISNAFGNGSSRCGWLAGVFVGVGPREMRPAGQEVQVYAFDGDRKEYAHFFRVDYTKAAVNVLPGLGVDSPS